MKKDTNDDDDFDAEDFFRDLIADDEPEVVAETTIRPKTEGSNDDDFDAAAFFQEAIGDDEPEVATPTIIKPKPWPKPIVRIRPPICNIPDALTSDFLEPAIAELEAAFDLWKTNSARTRQSLWDLLGNIYELSAKLMDNQNARSGLIGLVSRREDVKSSTNWRSPGTKHPRELLLVLLHGLSEDSKATKSQWLSALKAAEVAGIEKSKGDFVDWISRVGGVDGARKLVAQSSRRKSSIQIKDILASIRVHDDQQIELPFDMWGQEQVEGLSLMLVKHCSGNIIAPIFNFADERQIIAVWEAYDRRGRKIDRELRAELESNRKKFDDERTAKIRAEFKKAKRRGRTKLSFDEFRDEYEWEYPLTPQDERIRWEGGGDPRRAISYGPWV